MDRTSIAPSPTALLTLHECATIAEEVECELDRAAAVLDELLSHQEFPDATTELVAQNVLWMARKLERATDALYAHAKKAA